MNAAERKVLGQARDALEAVLADHAQNSVGPRTHSGGCPFNDIPVEVRTEVRWAMCRCYLGKAYLALTAVRAVLAPPLRLAWVKIGGGYLARVAGHAVAIDKVFRGGKWRICIDGTECLTRTYLVDAKRAATDSLVALVRRSP